MKVTPPRFAPGPVDGVDLEAAFRVFYRDVLARLDARYPNNDFNQGLVSNGTGGVTLGPQSFPTGRTAGMPALTQHIADSGKAADQRFLWPLSMGNHSSVQNASNILASNAAADATITINPHSVKYDFGSVAYNAGSVAGLTPGVGYLVYADDPNFQGGAVSYFATTNAGDMINQGRYYVGTMTTAAAGTSQLITAATSTNPVAFTTTSAHGWSNGNTITLAQLPGDFGTNLNNNAYTIVVTGSQTFTISIDGSAYAAYTAGGTATKGSGTTAGGGGAGAGGGGPGGRWQGFVP
jgi:hypothetical protein